MLMPSKLKHRKQPRGKNPGKATRGFYLSFGSYGLKSLGRGWITARQLEASRRAMTRYIKRGGAIWIRIFPDKPVTQQPAETGMGGGKGAMDHFVAAVKPGRIIFEMQGSVRLSLKKRCVLQLPKCQLKLNSLRKIKMKSKEELKNIRSKNVRDLYEDLKKQYQKLQELNFQSEFRKNKDLNSQKKTRRYVARIWTVLNEKLAKDDKGAKND